MSAEQLNRPRGKSAWDFWSKELEAKVIEMISAGISLREVSKICGCSYDILYRYRRKIYPLVSASVLKLRTSDDTNKPVPLNPATNPSEVQTTLTAQLLLCRLGERELERAGIRGFAVKERDYKGYAALDSCEFRDLELKAKIAGLLNSGGPTSVSVCLVVQDHSPQSGFTTRLQSPAEPIQDETIGNSAIIDVTAERR